MSAPTTSQYIIVLLIRGKKKKNQLTRQLKTQRTDENGRKKGQNMRNNSMRTQFLVRVSPPRHALGAQACGAHPIERIPSGGAH